MPDAERYRAFARQCMRWAGRDHNTIEHREALLEMATSWAEAAALLDRTFALVDQFDGLACKARNSPRAATDGHRETMNGNGSGETKHTDGLGGIDTLQSDSVTVAGNNTDGR